MAVKNIVPNLEAKASDGNAIVTPTTMVGEIQAVY